MINVAGFPFDEALVPTSKTRHRKGYDSHAFRGAISNLEGTAYFNPLHVDYVFKGEYGEERARAVADRFGGEYKPKVVNGALREHRARVYYPTAV